MFRPPFDALGSGFRGQTYRKAAKNLVRFVLFEKYFLKGIDDGQRKILAGNLSPSRELFEIYFVRLIGTPNQNSISEPMFTLVPQ